MKDSLEFYNAALQLQQTNIQYSNQYQENVKDAYLQIITAIFYELVTKKTSPLLSEMCLINKINFAGKNFRVEKITIRRLPPVETSGDMLYILHGLNTAFSENLDTCAHFYETYKDSVFIGAPLNENSFAELKNFLKALDEQLEKFSPQEKIVGRIIEKIEKEVAPQNDAEEKILFQELISVAKNRTSDDEKIIAEIKKVQAAMQNEVATIQNSLKQISEIRDGVDFRTLKEPIYQLIQLYNKLDDNLKRHPQEDASKGYAALIKRCQSFLKYITQSLEMLGVEIINNAGEKFDPDKNKVADDIKISFDSTVATVNKIGFMYKGQVLEKAEVEVAKIGG